jgi:hypothetical protein
MYNDDQRHFTDLPGMGGRRWVSWPPDPRGPLAGLAFQTSSPCHEGPPSYAPLRAPLLGERLIDSMLRP